MVNRTKANSVGEESMHSISDMQKRMGLDPKSGYYMLMRIKTALNLVPDGKRGKEELYNHSNTQLIITAYLNQQAAKFAFSRCIGCVFNNSNGKSTPIIVTEEDMQKVTVPVEDENKKKRQIIQHMVLDYIEKYVPYNDKNSKEVQKATRNQMYHYLREWKGVPLPHGNNMPKGTSPVEWIEKEGYLDALIAVIGEAEKDETTINKTVGSITRRANGKK